MADLSAAPARLAIIGCGNPARSDDGAGPEVIRALKARPMPADVRLIDAGTAGIDVMFMLRGARRVVIVDACRSGSEPGVVFRLPAREAATPLEPAYSLHGLRWDHALFAGRKIYGEDFADHAEVILIEAGNLGLGLGLSAPVRQAAERVAGLLAPLVAGTE